MSSSGLRVFWSNETLKQNVGQQFFDVVQSALVNSQHFILLCTEPAFESKWVNLEYTTFFNQCYSHDSSHRRLILVLGNDFDKQNIPPFLSGLQLTQTIDEILPALGGIDMAALVQENKDLKKRIEIANKTVEDLTSEKGVKEKSVSEALLRIEGESRKCADENVSLRAELALVRQKLRTLEDSFSKKYLNDMRLVKTLSVGENQNGVIIDVDDFGAFVALNENVVGYVHISQVSPARPDNLTEIVTKGDPMKTTILNIDSNGYILLRMEV